MQSNTLKRVHPNMKRMQVARGGKRGKTSGRGGKGQTARAGNKRRPEWRDIIKRVPKLRGRGKNSNKTVKNVFQEMVVVNLDVLDNNFDAGSNVTPTTLADKGVISTVSGRIPKVKLLGNGQITKKISVTGCLLSGSAKAAIEKAGGTVELMQSQIDAMKKGEEAKKKAEAPKVIPKESPKPAPKAVKKEKSEKKDKPKTAPAKTEKK